uniref:Sorting nexin-1 (Trinotate prediction) n=1 Tax=Henneguya salminicola TaxID=69463 RepID=A0A6G3MG40_HENSL
MNDMATYIRIKVVNPEKIGDGFRAYIRYTITTETNHSDYSATNFEVQRRFSDAHALYEYLVDVYRTNGEHIAHPPAKSMLTSARIKTNKSEPNELFQIEIRRHALEAFLNRLTRNPVIAKDKEFIKFLTSPVVLKQLYIRLLLKLGTI